MIERQTSAPTSGAAPTADVSEPLIDPTHPT